MSKGEIMQLVYSKEELRNIDSAIPLSTWKSHDSSIHVMNYNENRLGSLENLFEVAQVSE